MAEHPHHGALRRAVDRAENNQSKFARDVGTSQQLVSYWLANGKPLPGELVLAAERAGYGSRHELRPDLYPLEEAVDCSLCNRTFSAGEVAACVTVDCPVRQREAA